MMQKKYVAETNYTPQAPAVDCNFAVNHIISDFSLKNNHIYTFSQEGHLSNIFNTS